MWNFAANSAEPRGFVVDSVIPNMNWGPLLSPGRQTPSPARSIPGLYENELEALGMFRDYPPRESWRESPKTSSYELNYD